MPMTRAFYVAVPYSVAELTEPEEGHEIGGYIDHEGYDCRGYGGDVFADGEWHSVWGFGREAEAVRFVNGWGGLPLEAAAEARTTDVAGMRWN